MEKDIKIALECGFSHVGALDPKTLKVRQEVRDMCAVNTCHKYNSNWACPPACGELEDCDKQLKKYSKGLILQTTKELEDSMDFEGIQELGIEHAENIKKAVEAFSEKYPNLLMLGTGGCNVCKECAYPDNPCRFPKKRISSMEAYGLVVNDVCKANDIPYYYGKDTLTYIGCILFEQIL